MRQRAAGSCSTHASSTRDSCVFFELFSLAAQCLRGGRSCCGRSGYWDLATRLLFVDNHVRARSAKRRDSHSDTRVET